MSSKMTESGYLHDEQAAKKETGTNKTPRSRPVTSNAKRASLLFAGNATSAAPAVHIPFRAPRSYPPDTKMQRLLKIQESNFIQGSSVKVLVALPSDISPSEWLSINALFFYNQINDYYGYLSADRRCNCEKMTVGPKYEFLWADGKTIKQPINIPASDYIDYLMVWIEANFDDTRLFPDYDDGKYGKTHMELAKSIFKRLFRVLGHMAMDHESDLESQHVKDDVRRLLECFVEFVKKWKLMDKKQLKPVQKLTENWKKSK